MTAQEIQVKTINSITAHDIYFMAQKRKWNLWSIRDEINHSPLSQADLDLFTKITAEDNQDIKEVVERYNWF